MSDARPDPQKALLHAEIAAAIEGPRRDIIARLSGIDPGLLVQLTIGLGRGDRPEATWTDSWADRFIDNGKFSDLWINLSGAQELRNRPLELPMSRGEELDSQGAE